MKKRTILAFGLLTALIVVSVGSFTGSAAGALVILPDNGYCTPDPGGTCWINAPPGSQEERDQCDACCEEGWRFYKYVNDRYGCYCCDMPW